MNSTKHQNNTNPNFPPKRILDFAKLPIEKEVMELEYELDVLCQRDVLSDYDKKLQEYLYSRCGKLWKKIYNSSHRAFVESFTSKK